MGLLKKRGDRVLFLPAEEIRPNPDQPRTVFDPAGLKELAESIKVHGILQPLTVRRESSGRYTLIAGERRLRAAKLAGLKEVPCLLTGHSREESALLALVENLQRRDLDCWEEAEALRRLMSRYGLTQEQAAEKIGKSQSAVANKLRLLKLPGDVVARIRAEGLTERHARALLRLPETLQSKALDHIIAHKLNVAAAEAYIDTLVLSPAPRKRKKPTILLRDVRLFLNTLDRGVSALKQSGLKAQWQQEDTGEELLLTIRIPKKAAPKDAAG